MSGKQGKKKKSDSNVAVNKWKFSQSKTARVCAWPGEPFISLRVREDYRFLWKNDSGVERVDTLCQLENWEVEKLSARLSRGPGSSLGKHPECWREGHRDGVGWQSAYSTRKEKSSLFLVLFILLSCSPLPPWPLASLLCFPALEPADYWWKLPQTVN